MLCTPVVTVTLLFFSALRPCLVAHSYCLQVVVHGIPWSYDHEQLAAMFTDWDPSYEIEVAEVVFGRDGRSRVRHCWASCKRTCCTKTCQLFMLLS